MSHEQVSFDFPPVPQAPSFLRRLLPSNGVTAAIVLALAAYLWLRFSSPAKKAPRRGPLKSATGPRTSTFSSAARPVPVRTASPQLSRRSSAVYGPPRPIQQQQQYYQQPSGSGRNSPMRPSFGSSRRMAELANGGYASSSGGYREQSAGPEHGRYEPECYSRPSASYSSAVPASLGRPPPRPSLARPSPSQNRSATHAAPPLLSPNPRRRFTDAGPSSAARGSKRQHEDDERQGKRWKQADGSGEDERVEMEVDEQRYEPRGTKRASREPASSAAKRSRRNDDEDEEDEMDDDFELEDDGDDDESETEDEPQRKRRARESGSDDGHGSKRAKAGARTKPGSKRDFDDVDPSDELSEIGDDRDRPHNADSDFGSDEEAVAAPIRVRKDGKRAREARGRRDSNDVDVMDGTMDEPATASTSAPAAKKRTLASRPQQSTPLNRKGKNRASPAPVVVRKPGDEWYNSEGDRLKLGPDGVQRKLCEVREIRKQFKMPKDSRHPDRDVTHEVIAEKWLTDDEHKQYVLEGRMAWQPPLVPEVEPVKTEPDEVELSSRQLAKKKDSGIYYMQGTGTPLRSHANLSRPTTPLSASTRSPSLSTLVNGRLRLPSGAAAASPARSWSHGKAGRMVEDEQKAKMERERRRKASIALGGEPEKAAESPAAVEKPQEKLKLSDFGATAPAPVAFGSDIQPTAVPSASLFNPTPSTSASVTPSPSTAPKAIPSFFAPPPVVPATSAPVPSFKPTVTAAPVVSTSTAPSFSFPLAKPAVEPPKVAASGFQFGPAPVAAAQTSTEPAKAPFSFGAATAPLAPPVEAPKPKTQPNFFGTQDTSTAALAPTPAAQTPVQAAASTFKFGPAPAMPPAPVPASTPLFGNAPTVSAGTTAPSMFGAPASASGSGPSLFGNAGTSTTTSLFGGGSTSAPSATPSLFGGVSNAPAQPALFGNTSAAPAAPSLFGAAPSLFGSTSAAPAAPSLFGGAGTTPASAPAFGFGTPAPSTPAATGFGGAAPPAAAGGFSFNAQPPAAPGPPAAGSPFTFGSTPIAFGGAPAPGAAPGGAPGMFGAGAPAAAPSFAFGSGDSTGGTGTPDVAAGSRRRRVRPLPGR